MSDQFTKYIRDIGLEPIELDLNKEKPDTLSFQLASFVANVRRLAETIKAKNTRNEPLQIHVGVTTELDGNAFACASDNHQYIGITFGHYLSSAYFSLQSFFMTKAFNDIGTPPDNHASTLELCPETKFWENEGVTTLNEFRNIETYDPLRIGGALFLTYVMTMLAFHHEFFHVFLGHCPILKKLGLRGRILEVGNADVSDFQGRVSRSFEAVADQDAIISLINMILADGDLLTGTGKFVKISIPDKLRLLLVGAGLLTASWFSWQKNNGLKSTSHPDPGARFLHFYCTTQETLRLLGREEVFTEASGKAIDDLARIALRCPDLAWAMTSIGKGPSRRQSIEPVPPDIMELLEKEGFVIA